MSERLAASWLGRDLLDISVVSLARRVVLVTGSEGYIGSRTCRLVEQLGGTAVAFDNSTKREDILDLGYLAHVAELRGVDAIVHLAAHKYATTGEDMPAEVAAVNVQGTANVRAVAQQRGADLIVASTCKAVDPCTAYGASKLLAEREAMRYERARVLRLVNVLGSTGSVVDIWASVDSSAPLPLVPEAHRMWITAGEATALLVALFDMPHGLYIPRVPPPEPVTQLLSRVFPRRPAVHIPLRRGDRPVERLVGEYETAEQVSDALARVNGPWG